MSTRPEYDLFMDTLYDGLNGYIYAALKTEVPVTDKNPRGISFEPHFFKWPENRTELAEWTFNSTEQGEVYYAPSVMGVESVSRAAFAGSKVTWVEFDGNAQQAAYSLKPSIILQSSDENHHHAYWLLDTPVTDINSLEAVNKSLAYSLNGDLGAWDYQQLLRPPGTTNHGIGKQGHAHFIDGQTYKVKVVEQNGVSYSQEHFNVTIEVVEPKTTTLMFSDPVPDVAEVLLRYPWTDKASELYRRPEIPLGERSEAIMRLGYECAEMGMTDAEMYAVLRNADDRWKKFTNRNEESRWRALVAIVNVARQKYPYSAPIDLAPAPMVFGYSDFLNSDIEVEWVVENLLMEEGIMLFAGPPGIGKTQVTLEWCKHLALGKDFLGYKINTPRRILVWSLEMGHPDLKFILGKQHEFYTPDEHDMLQQNMQIIPYGEPLPFDSEDNRKLLIESIETFQPHGIIVDSVGAAIRGDISSEGPVKDVMGFFEHINRRFGTFTWLIHHNRKASGDNKKPQALDDVYGNQYLTAKATSVFGVYKGEKGNDTVKIKALKMRLGRIEDPYHIQRVPEHPLNFRRWTEVGLSGFTPDTQHVSYKQPDLPEQTHFKGNTPGGLTI